MAPCGPWLFTAGAGETFLGWTAGFDGMVRLWDPETEDLIFESSRRSVSAKPGRRRSNMLGG
jgi:hypothetical protein